MRKTHMIMATAMTLALAASASLADAKPTRHHSLGTAKANAVTAQLNQQQLQGNASVNAGSTTDTTAADVGTGNSLSNSTGVQATDSTGSINSAAATTDKSSVPAGSMSSTTNSAVAGDTTAAAPTSDSTVPEAGQKVDPSAAQAKPSQDKGAAGKNANPTDATDQPAQ